MLALVELTRCRRDGFRLAARSLTELTLTAVAVYFAVLAAFDRIAPPYDPQTGRTITGGPLAHTERILSYAAAQTSPHAPPKSCMTRWTFLIPSWSRIPARCRA